MKKRTKSDMPVANKGMVTEVLQVLSDNWQTNSLISAQLVFRPETLARYRKRFNSAEDRSHMGRCVAQSIFTIHKQGWVEKRINKVTGKMEYRLTPKGMEAKQNRPVR